MENIVDPDDTFDFSKLKLGHPANIQGGAYFTQLEYNSSPLYIQTPKCLSKQGIVKTGKKYYMDLMFGNKDEGIIKWIENLEEKCKSLLFEKRDEWFQNSLDENDIDNAFNSIFKIYKSGRYYVLKCNVKSLSSNEPNVKIYNENKEAMAFQLIDDKSDIITIIEIRGIRFTTRNFQLDIELKQIMVLDNDPLFNNCIIKNKQKDNVVDKKEQSEGTDNESEFKNQVDNQYLAVNNLYEKDHETENNEDEDKKETVEQLLMNEEDLKDTLDNEDDRENKGNEQNELIAPNEVIEESAPPENIKYYVETIDDSGHLNSNEDVLATISNNENIDKEEIIKENIDGLEEVDLNFSFPDELTDNDDLKEININDNHLEENNDLMLKKPNQIFYDLYREARDKAKKAKNDAILAFLEAKKIKQTYMLENLNDLEDSDIDEDIDQVSESELNV